MVRKITVQARQCSVDGCDRGFYGRELCEMHYYRWKKTGDVRGLGAERHFLSLDRPDELRTFLLDSRVITAAGCWEWTRGKSNGYGVKRVNGKILRIPRLSLYLFKMESMDDARQVCHHCDNPPCFNPDHLFFGTHADNMRDMAEKGYMKGSANWRAKLDEHRVARIKLLLSCGVPFGEVAPLFGVKTATVWMIAKGKSWKHVMV